MNWLTSVWEWLAGWFFSPDDRIKEVQKATVAVCRFLPTVTTVTNLLALQNPGLLTAQAIAVAICTAIRNQPLSTLASLGEEGQPKPTVQGVVIEGEFVD